MNTDQLEAFDRIVRDGTFSRAARSLDISQPSISARIQALEEEVGGQLFIRSGRRVSLTELGESFLPYARRALSILAEGTEAARLAQEGQRGRVTVGAIESLTGSFLASAVAHFHQTHARVDLFIRSGHTHQIVQMLQDGVVKLGLIAWPVSSADLVPLLRFREPLRLIVPALHPLARRDTVTLEEAARLGNPLLHVRWGPSAGRLMARLESLPGVNIEVPIDTAREMVLNGVGASFLTHTLVADDLTVRRVIEIPISD
ncbi:MAG: LysR family transcriptional regulator, partial [Chloroflexota bacterium]|nr:LysR family transcriptional regulator [Chloroflexota bacterium]